METWREIIVAVIGVFGSVIVARLQAKRTANTTAEAKATETATATTHDILANGVYKELKTKVTRLEVLSDMQAAKLDRFTVVSLERDDLTHKIDACSVVDCPVRLAVQKARQP